MSIFFLSFANSTVKPLPNLKVEAQKTYNFSWKKGIERGFSTYYEAFATIESLNTGLENANGNVSVFLYSGHANANTILLEDNIGNLDGVAMHLKSSVDSGTLKLVILNGCATKAAVTKFLESGVPVVIATQAKVNDESASAFGISLFEHLVEREESIIDSFNAALKSAQVANTKIDLSNKIPRGVDFASDYNEAIPMWEIFCIDESSINEKCIPAVMTTPFEVGSIDKLMRSIFTGFYNAGNEKAINLWRSEQLNRTESDLSEIEQVIINNIPRPIGVELSNLIKFRHGLRSGMNIEKLKQIFRVYHSTNEFIVIILVAQVWELSIYATKRNIALKIPTVLRDELKRYFYLNRKARESYDYTSVVLESIRFFESLFENDHLKEFVQSQEIIRDFTNLDVDNYSKITKDIYGLKSELERQFNQEEARSLYGVFEDNICALFILFSFLHRYKLKSVHSINAYKDRPDSHAKFTHTVRGLHQAVFDKKENISSYKYMDSHGVAIILKSDNELTLDYLSLSPFIIDFTAYDHEADKSYINKFSEFKNDKQVFYMDLSAPYEHKEIKPSNEKLREKVIKEFRHFRKDVLGETI